MSYRQLERMSPTTESVHRLIMQVPTFLPPTWKATNAQPEGETFVQGVTNLLWHVSFQYKCVHSRILLSQ